MNATPGETTPGPHGPQVIPGVYTLKLTVDGQVYTRKVTVFNDPRVGQSPTLMTALRAQNQLTMLAYQGMRQSFDGNQEVAAVRGQIAELMRKNPPADIAAQAKTLDESLGKIGGVVPPPGAPFRRAIADPKALQSFLAINNEYNTMVSMMQVGMDVAPTPAQVDAWESECPKYNRTLGEWKAAQKQIDDFNAVLAKNNLPQITAPATKLTDEVCTFKAEATVAAKK